MKVIFIALAIAMMACGCTTKSKAQARAREAYLAGQHQALAQIENTPHTGILFIGPVKNHEIPWTDGLTLARAIAAAEYTDARDPRTIVVNRQHERIPFDPADLLQGKDLELQSGDTIEIHP